MAVPFSVGLDQPGVDRPGVDEPGSGRLELDLSAAQPVRVDVRAEPTWLIDHGPTAWTHVAPSGRVTVQGGSQGSGTLTVTVVAQVAGDGVTAVRRSVTQHPLVIR